VHRELRLCKSGVDLRSLGVAAQAEFESKIEAKLKAIYQNLV
jgi:hypothetical protein